VAAFTATRSNNHFGTRKTGDHFNTGKAYFHYVCALRCVAKDIETPIVFLFLSPRNAARSRNGNQLLSID